MATFGEVPPGNARAGEKIFRAKCAHCHTLEKGSGHKHDYRRACDWLLVVILFFATSLPWCTEPPSEHKPWFLKGPNLHGLFGKQYGTTPGFSYSAASKNKDVVWEENTLYDYLLNPKEYIPLKAKFPCMKNPQERADLIAFLKETTS
ncbi:hypothetical protein ZIOFF_051932 [Zingiber officinale]|uniref:Cytochrome c domain-containing protein n=1 Tax=Zingiber officinale TaxID=94328 RepID=A0A8J5KV10_ZINOF|nr:hypothetical protein ZIOFF_051932 [Zingiber officinale]